MGFINPYLYIAFHGEIALIKIVTTNAMQIKSTDIAIPPPILMFPSVFNNSVI